MSKFVVSKVICESFDFIKLHKSSRKEEKLFIIGNLSTIILKISHELYFLEIVPGILSEIFKIILDKNSFRVKIKLLEIFANIIQSPGVYDQFHLEILKIIRILNDKFHKENGLDRELKLGFLRLLILSIQLSSKSAQKNSLESGLRALVVFLGDQDLDIVKVAQGGLRYATASAEFRENLMAILEKEMKDLKDLSDLVKVKELIGILQVLSLDEKKEQNFSIKLSTSEENIRTLLKSLKENHLKEISRTIKEVKEIQGYGSESVEVFFETYGSCLGLVGVKSFLVNLIPFIKEGELQVQALFVLKNLIKGLRGSVSKVKDVHEKRFLRKLFKDIIAFHLNELPLSVTQEQFFVKMQELKPWNHLGAFYAIEKLENQENTTRGIIGAQEYERNVIVQSLFLEFLGELSGVLGKEFEPFLIDGLYPVLEKLNKSNETVSIVAWKVLSQISKHMDSEGVTEEDQIKNLLVKNVDYIINHVSRNLRQFELHPYAPNVLSASIRIVGSHILDVMDDSILELLDLLGEYHNVNENVVHVLLDVFHALADVMSDQSVQSKDSLKLSSNDTKKIDLSSKFGKASHEMVAFFLKNQKSQTKEKLSQDEAEKSAKEFFSSINSDKSEMEAQELNPPETEPEAKDKEVHVTISKECKFAGLILPKLTHFLTVDSPRLRKYVIELLGKLVPFLEEREPFIHTVWSSLVYRLDDSQYYIVEEALLVISKICNLSPDFVSKRISDDIIPKILVILANLNRDLNEYSESTINGFVVSNLVSGNLNYSKKFKLILRILESIENLLRPLSVNFADTKNLTEALIPLLRQDYPGQITSSAKTMLRHLLSKNHGDVVYFRLWISCAACELVPFNSNLKSLSIPSWMIQKSDKYIVNASAVLDQPLSIDWNESLVSNGVWRV